MAATEQDAARVAGFTRDIANKMPPKARKKYFKKLVDKMYAPRTTIQMLCGVGKKLSDGDSAGANKDLETFVARVPATKIIEEIEIHTFLTEFCPPSRERYTCMGLELFRSRIDGIEDSPIELEMLDHAIKASKKCIASEASADDDAKLSEESNDAPDGPAQNEPSDDVS